MKLKSTNKPSHESPAERVRRVCGRPFTDRDFSHPTMIGLGLFVLILGILAVFMLVMPLVMSIMEMYGDRIWELISQIKNQAI